MALTLLDPELLLQFADLTAHFLLLILGSGELILQVRNFFGLHFLEAGPLEHDDLHDIHGLTVVSAELQQSRSLDTAGDRGSFAAPLVLSLLEGGLVALDPFWAERGRLSVAHPLLLDAFELGVGAEVLH